MSEHTRQPRLLLTTREMLVVCVTILLVIVIGVGYRLVSGSQSSTSAAWTVGGDFVAFYIGGRILNDYDPARLYDLDLQEQLYRELVPDATRLALPYPYPPFVAALFRPLALLPYSAALVIFLTVMPLVFLGSIALLVRQFGPADREERALALLGGLSFFPFAGYTWLGAQITVVAFASVAAALIADDRGKYFLSGLALCLCLYKPTLLLLIVPMLLVSGRVRHLAGLAAGTGLVVAISLAVAGAAASRAFVERLRWMGSSYTGETSVFVNPYRFVDLNSFFRLLPYGRSLGGQILLGLIAVAAAIALIFTWMRARNAERGERMLVWAATLVWTSVLNVYTSAYDTIFVVAAAILAVAAIRARGSHERTLVGVALLIVYIAPWIAELSTHLIKVQIYTLALTWFGSVLLWEARRPAISPPPAGA